MLARGGKVLPQVLPVAAQLMAIAVNFTMIAAHLGAVTPQFARTGPVAIVPPQVAPVGAQIPLVAPEFAVIALQLTRTVPHCVGRMQGRRTVEQRGIGGLGGKGSSQGQCRKGTSQCQQGAGHRRSPSGGSGVKANDTEETWPWGGC
jgi:hypothetical protein